MMEYMSNIENRNNNDYENDDDNDDNGIHVCLMTIIMIMEMMEIMKDIFVWHFSSYQMDAYLIFVIFFTQAKILDRKFYTEERVNYGFRDKIA